MARRIPLTSKRFVPTNTVITEKVSIMYYNYNGKNIAQNILKKCVKLYFDKMFTDLLNGNVATIKDFKLEIVKYNKKKLKGLHYRHDNKQLYFHDNLYRYTVLITENGTNVNSFYPLITDSFGNKIIEAIKKGIQFREIEYEEYCKYKISDRQIS
jgi:hypothetical protein